MLEMRKGNTFVFTVSVQDVNGDALTTLGAALSIKCMIKSKQTDTDSDAIISKTDISGIVIDTPSTGDLKITFDSADTESLLSGSRYIAVEIEDSTGAIQEIQLQYKEKDIENINITPDSIRG